MVNTRQKWYTSIWTWLEKRLAAISLIIGVIAGYIAVHDFFNKESFYEVDELVSYKNGRYGFLFNHPLGWYRGSSPINGDGLHAFDPSDTLVVIQGSGSHHIRDIYTECDSIPIPTDVESLYGIELTEFIDEDLNCLNKLFEDNVGKYTIKSEFSDESDAISREVLENVLIHKQISISESYPFRKITSIYHYKKSKPIKEVMYRTVVYRLTNEKGSKKRRRKEYSAIEYSLNFQAPLEKFDYYSKLFDKVFGNYDINNEGEDI